MNTYAHLVKIGVIEEHFTPLEYGEAVYFKGYAIIGGGAQYGHTSWVKNQGIVDAEKIFHEVMVKRSAIKILTTSLDDMQQGEYDWVFWVNIQKAILYLDSIGQHILAAGYRQVQMRQCR